MLAIAEAANPEWTSVPLVGWSHAQALSRVARVHLVTQVRNRPAIERAGLVEGRDFTAIDSELVARPAWQLSSLLRAPGTGLSLATAGSAFAYYYFERLLWRRFRAALRAGRFDVVHRITPLSPVVPSLLAARCSHLGIPFVLGPLNGGVPWPRGLGSVRRSERDGMGRLRALHKLLPGYVRTRRHADAILVGSTATWKEIPRRFRDRCIYMPENGIDPERFGLLRTRRTRIPLKVGFVGRLVPLKGVDMLIEALAPLLRSGQVELDVIGDGPQRPELEDVARRNGLAPSLCFAGWIPQERLPSRLAELDVLALPSVREFGGGVVLEGMSMGVVPVVLRYGGPGELVTPSSGFLIPIAHRASLIEYMRRLFERIVGDPDEVGRRSTKARERAHRFFTWEAKARQVLEVYRWVLGQRAGKPDFGMPFPELPEASSAREEAAARGATRASE